MGTLQITHWWSHAKQKERHNVYYFDCLTKGNTSEPEIPLEVARFSGELARLCTRALKVRGSFSTSGRLTGILPAVGGLLHEAGFVQIRRMSHAVDFSSYTPREVREAWMQNWSTVYRSMQGMLIGLGVITKEQVERLYDQMLEEMRSDAFAAIMLILTTWAMKPD